MKDETRNGVPEEVEWQFAADDLEAVERWLLENPAVTVAETREISDTYLDTEDWTLYKAGYALRLRKIGTGAETTMKSFSSGGEDGLRRRREISERLESGNLKNLRRASGPVGERLRALGVRRTVRPMFEIQTRRQAFDLASESGPSGEVVLDTSAVKAEERESATLYRVEVEVGPGDVENAAAFRRGATGRLRATERCRVEVCGRARGFRPPDARYPGERSGRD